MEDRLPQHLSVLRERPGTGGHLIQRRTRGINIAADVWLLMLELFRSHIWRSTPGAGGLHGYHLGVGKRLFIRHSKKLGQPEVEDFENTLRRNSQIAGLKIAMKNASGMGRR